VAGSPLRPWVVVLLLTACGSATQTAGDAGNPPDGTDGATNDAGNAGDTPDGPSRDAPVAEGSTDTGADADDTGAVDADSPSGPPRRTPDEVLVVLNSSSPTSTAIANDYAQKRNVKNVLSIQCVDSALSSDNETIALADYTTSIATPVSQYLASHSGIQFIVLTKGIPIRIGDANTGCCMNGGGPGQPSVDSYLAAIDYPTIQGATKLPITGSGTVGTGWLNRYWNANEPFSHEKFGGYLVTRLDGYTQANAMGLVTQALAAEQGMASGPALFDVDINHGLGDKTAAPEPITALDYDPTMGVTSEWDWSVWNADMLHARDLLEASGISNQLSMNGTFAGNATNLHAYFSWGSNDSTFDQNAYESLMFAPGSLADTAVSTSGRTFLPTSGGQSLVADLVAHGLTSGKGYVGEPLLQGVASPSIALARYYSGYSMAESLYAASRFTGWEDVVLGDPLGTPYYGASPVVVPTYASAFDDSSGGVQTESCSEGSLDVGNISDGSYTVYKSFPLTGKGTFVVRVASAGAGGQVEVHIDSPAGSTLGTCAVPITGDWQAWNTQTCPLSAATGTHDLYLVFSSGTADGGGFLFNLQWFALRP
jgi:uncharacterized protein (TIGR03790 family)